MSRKENIQIRRLSGRMPLLNWLGLRWTILGLLGRKVESGGVMEWVTFDGVGAFDLDLVFGPLVCSSGVGVSGAGGAQEPLRADRVLILSISTLRNGSGSMGSMISLSSMRLGL